MSERRVEHSSAASNTTRGSFWRMRAVVSSTSLAALGQSMWMEQWYLPSTIYGRETWLGIR